MVQRYDYALRVNHSSLNQVVAYIQNQKEHHTKKSFKEEYLDFLRKFDVEYNEMYVFDWIPDEER